MRDVNPIITLQFYGIRSGMSLKTLESFREISGETRSIVWPNFNRIWFLIWSGTGNARHVIDDFWASPSP